MKSNIHQIKINFSLELDRSIRSHFSKFPSNEYFSREFYRSSSYKLKVNRETVRKWLKSDSFPDLVYLLHLIDWLGLDMSKVFISGNAPNNNMDIQNNVIQNNSQAFLSISAEEIELFLKFLNNIKVDILKRGSETHQ